MAWAEEVLFAAHLGTTEQREELEAALVGVSVDIVRQFARHVYAFKMAGVYLVLVGTVEDLRESMGLAADLPWDMLVLKWGRTEDLDMRLKDHDRQYGSLDGASLCLVSYFAPIDPRYQSRAEADAKESVCEIGTHLTGVRLRGEAKKELVLFTKANLKVAAKHAFQRIAFHTHSHIAAGPHRPATGPTPTPTLLRDHTGPPRTHTHLDIAAGPHEPTAGPKPTNTLLPDHTGPPRTHTH